MIERVRRPSCSATPELRRRLLAASAVALAFAVVFTAIPGAAGVWITEASLPSAIQEVSVVQLNNLVYAVGGSLNQARSNQTRVYAPSTQTWSTVAPYPGTARDHMGIAALNGVLYLIGGVTAWPQPSVATVQRYDPVSNTWTSVASLPVARAATGVAVLNGKIYVAGGLVAGASVADFTAYDPGTNTWTTLAAMPTARDHLTAGAANGKIYAIGGRNNANVCAPFKTVEVYDPATNSWTAGPPMLNAHAGHSNGAVNGHIQVFGGEGNPSNCSLTIAASEDFDPLANTWTSLPDMPVPRHGTGGATVGTDVYIPGGGTATGDFATTANQRFAAAASSTLPSPWNDLDIGVVGATGNASFNSGTFTISGAGADIWGTADAFNYVYQPLNGDGSITAHIVSLQNTNTFAKAGVMIRETLTPGSSHALLDVKGGGGVEFLTRTSTGGSTAFNAGATASAPVWLRLVRSAATITASASLDGVTWTPVGTATVSMATSVFVGLAVTSHVAGTLTTSTIDNVTVTVGGGGGDSPPAVSLTAPANGTTYTAPATIALAATAADGDATPVARVDFYANTTLLGSDTTSPYSLSWSNVPAGTYSLTAVAVDTGGLQTTSAPVGVTVNSASGGGSLPAPWTDQDVGSTGIAGSASYATGVFTVKGAGADIWGTADAFNYVYQPLNGDGSITAHIVSLQNTNTFAKAGVMIRETLTPGSRHALLDVKGGGGVEFLTRTTAGGSTAFSAGATASAPVWLRLVRSAATITASASLDGVTWTPVGTATVSMATSVFVGLAVTSHVAGTLTTSTIDNVTVTGGGGGGDSPPAVSLTAPAGGTTYMAPATIALAATATDGDATPVARVDFYANTTLLGSDTTSPYALSWSNVPAGTYSLTAVAVDTGGLQTTSAPVSVTVNSASGGGSLPAPWTDQDIGSVAVTGSASYASGVFTVKGAGADIWGTADAFNFAAQPLTGDGFITARLTGIQNTNAFAKAGVMLRNTLAAGSEHAIFDMKPDGGLEFMSRATAGGTTAFLGGGTGAPGVWIRLARAGNVFTAYVSTDGAAWTVVGSQTVTMASTIYAGLAVTSHTTSALNTSTFDNVSVNVGTIAPPPTVSFTPKALAIGGSSSGTAVGIAALQGPTSLTLGPDGKLYVSVVNGKLFILTLDPAKLAQAGQVAVTNVQELDDIYLKPSRTCNINNDPNNCQYLSSVGSGRQVTGILIGPESTASRISLYVSNSGLGKDVTDITLDTYSGTITRLILQPDPASPNNYNVVGNQDLVAGLPRSREAHAINGMSVGPDGWLYLSVGGHTNAGQPSTFFVNLPEYYLSASVVRVNLANLGTTLPIDVSNVHQASDLSPLAGRFELYSTGYRNGYDLTWHSNGRLYLNGNAANLDQGNTPGASDGCSTPSISPGNQPDTLNLVTKGAYAGHPNPARGECVWGDGTIYTPDLAPLANFVPPIVKYVNGSSTDGIVEYKSNAFNGAMQGNLISATFGGDQNVRRVILTPDGSGVSQVINMGAMVQPLDVWADAGGNIFVAEYGANRITVLLPAQLGSCPVPNSNPNVTDSDGDGYMDADETANGTDPCSAASQPPDFDGDKISDLLDSDDDNDGIPDTQDQLYFDPQNGAATRLPFALEWNPSDPAYGKVANSGFTGIQISSKAAVDQASGHALAKEGIHPGDAGGHLNLWTYPGTAEGTANTQVNALEVGFDSSTDFRVWSRIVQPFTGTTPAAGHVGGIFVGPGEDNYVRLALLGTAGGGKVLQVALEVGGIFVEQARLDFSAATIGNLDLFLVGQTATHTVTAYYDLNTSGTMTPLGAAFSVPATWFSSNAGSGGNTSLTGVMASQGSAPQMAFGYDFFRIDRNVPASTPPAALSAPSPSNGTTGVSTTTSLGWAASSGATQYGRRLRPLPPLGNLPLGLIPTRTTGHAEPDTEFSGTAGTADVERPAQSRLLI